MSNPTELPDLDRAAIKSALAAADTASLRMVDASNDARLDRLTDAVIGALARRTKPEGEAPQAEASTLVDRLRTRASSAYQFVTIDQAELRAAADEIERLAAAQHAESGAQADRIKELESLVGVAEAELCSMDRDLAAARAAHAAQSQGAQAAIYHDPALVGAYNQGYEACLAAQQVAAPDGPLINEGTSAPGTPEAPKGGA